MLRVNQTTAFASVLEVIITSVIFMLAAFGIMTTISMLRPHDLDSYRQVEAAYHAKNMMDYLSGQVDAATWDTGDLSVGAHSRTIGIYTIDWTVTDVAGGYPAGLAPRKVTMNVSYPD